MYFRFDAERLKWLFLNTERNNVVMLNGLSQDCIDIEVDITLPLSSPNQTERLKQKVTLMENEKG